MPPDEHQLTGEITVLLRRARTDSGPALDELFRLIYDDLRLMAKSALHAGGYAYLGLDGTAVVNAACARLLGRNQLDAQDRRHFFFLLSRAMQDVLVEEARAALAAKRGGKQRRVELTDDSAETAASATVRLDVIELHKAIEELRAADPEAARLVELRYFAGRTLEETAEIMETTVAVVRRNWAYARAWLAERLANGPPRQINPEST